jgi:hypothetical protein
MAVPFLVVSSARGSAPAAAGTIGPAVRYLNQAKRGAMLASKVFHRARKLSLRGAQRRSNLLPDERTSARQAGDCFGAARLAMTGLIHDRVGPAMPLTVKAL